VTPALLDPWAPLNRHVNVTTIVLHVSQTIKGCMCNTVCRLSFAWSDTFKFRGKFLEDVAVVKCQISQAHGFNQEKSHFMFTFFDPCAIRVIQFLV
jgi:hypothetical protein